MREAELKHARIAMLAVVGSVAQEAGFVFPGLVSYYETSKPITTLKLRTSNSRMQHTPHTTANREEPSRCLLEVPRPEPRPNLRRCSIPLDH
jgi:Chlorophyll A-B binding protein